MKRFLLMFVATNAFILNAFAMTDGKYACTVYPNNSAPNVALNFEIKDGEVTCQKEEDDYCSEYFSFANNDKAEFMLDMSDGGYGYDREGNWVVIGDSDGCNLGNMTLYKNSAYTKGFILTEFACDQGQEYAGKVYCQRE